MRYLVTGGSGMLGSHLKEEMPDLTYLSRKDCDLTSMHEVEKLIKFYKPYGIIHSAAKVGGILENIKSPADFYDQNILMNTNLLVSSMRNNVTRFLGILSTCMYPEKSEIYPMAENNIHDGPPPASNFSYGYAKRAMGVQIEAYREQYGLKYNYLIPCNLYGEHDNFKDSLKSHFVTALIKKIIDAERAGQTSIEIFGTGKPLRQFMYCGDLARVIKKIIENDIDGSFNVAPPEQNYSIEEIALKAFRSLSKQGWAIRYDHTKPDGVYRKDVSCSKMLDVVGDFHFTPIESGIRKVYNKIVEEE
jgi:GDP-L-fucose synthase